jgi:D-alanine-D-alanine ligase
MSKADVPILNGWARVGVLLGGISSERAVSLRSGEAIYRALQSQNIPVVKIDIKRPLSRTLREYPIQAAFLALHGKGGEDGTIQRELERRGIPYTGSSAKGSHQAFNKALTKTIFEKRGIPTPRWVLVSKKDFKKKLSRFSFPVFSKPLENGSSIGVRRVGTYEEFLKKARQIFGRESRLLVEEAISGREITVGIFKEKPLPVIELKTQHDFYDYKAKYTKGKTRYLIPAPLAPRIVRHVQRIALKAHRVLGLRDFSRVDVMLDKSGAPYVLEVNTIPGFTSLSLLPKAAQAAGISFEKLCLEILEMAKKRK